MVTGEVPLLDTLPSGTRGDFERACRRVRLRKGQTLFEEGEAAREAYRVTEGRLLLRHLRPDGTVRTVCVLGVGEFLCCLSILDLGPYPATAIAATPAKLLAIPIERFRRLLLAHPAFGEVALGRICRSLRGAACRDGGSDVGSRLAVELLRMAEKFGPEVPLTRQQLAELADTSVETAIRELKAFEREGWVELHRARIHLLAPGALRERTGHRHHAPLRGRGPRPSAEVPLP